MDNDNDGVGDVNLAGVPIKLLGSSGAVVATTVTDSSGNYFLSALPVSTYSVRETNLVSTPHDVFDADGGSDLNMISVTIGGVNPLDSIGNNFVDKPSRTITGVVLKANDSDNTGEDPIPSVTVALVDDTNTVIAATTTDLNGAFTFGGVPPGNYTVVETNEPGFVDVIDSDGGDPNIISVNVSSGDSLSLVFVDKKPNSAPSVIAAPSGELSSSPSGSAMPSVPPSFVDERTSATPSASSAPSAAAQSASPRIRFLSPTEPSEYPNGKMTPSGQASFARRRFMATSPPRFLTNSASSSPPSSRPSSVSSEGPSDIELSRPHNHLRRRHWRQA